jgi:hypothetical protein
MVEFWVEPVDEFAYQLFLLTNFYPSTNAVARVGLLLSYLIVRYLVHEKAFAKALTTLGVD